MPDTPQDSRAELVEKLAAIEHERWADWQKYCHKVLRENNPSPEQGDILERWDRQIKTPYPQLSDREKQSDREQVMRYLPLLDAYVAERVAAARVDELNMIDQAYSWKSIVTYSGFKKWKANRLAKLKRQLTTPPDGDKE